MNYNFDLNRLTEGRKRELARMVADFSEEGCLFVEDLFLDLLNDYEYGNDRSCSRMTVTFGDECGNELTFILSHEEIEYVSGIITERIDQITVDDDVGGDAYDES